MGRIAGEPGTGGELPILFLLFRFVFQAGGERHFQHFVG